MQDQSLAGAFANPAVDAAHAFRSAMNAMAKPGQVFSLKGATPPAPMSAAAGCLLLTLCDAETPLYLAGELDSQVIRDWITFHTSAPIVAAKQAVFALGTWDDLAPITQFAIGTSEYPDRSATLIVESAALSTNGATLRGPGIKDTASLSLPEVRTFQQNAALFPLGLDFYFTSGTQVAALPRTTKVNI